MAAMWVPGKRHSLERPAALAWHRWRDGGGRLPGCVQFLSILQTKASWRVKLINLGGISPSRGGPGTGHGRSKGRCPRETPVSFLGAGAGWGWHLPWAVGWGQRLWGSGVGHEPVLQPQLGLAGESGGRRAAGARAVPGVQSQELESASCWFMPRSVHISDKEPVPVTSACYSPKACPREMELAARGPGGRLE